MSRRISQAAVTLLILLTAGPLAAQDQNQAPGLTAAQKADRAIRQAYDLSQNGKDEADFIQMAELLESVLQEPNLAQKTRDYAARLKGWAHNRRGELLAKEGKEKIAAIQFETAVELNPNHWKARYNRGVSYSLEGQIDKAIDELNTAIDLNGGYARSWFNRGEAFYAQGKLRESIRDYTQAIRLDRENALFYHHRGHSYYLQRRYQQAISDYDRSIELNAEDVDPYVYRGDAYAELGAYEQAIQDYRRALALDKNLGRAYLSVAWLLATCPDDDIRNEKQALAAAKKAISLDGEAAGHRYLEALAAAQANAGEFDEAQETQQKVVEQAPEQLQVDCRVRLVLYSKKQPYRQQPAAAAGEWRSQVDP